MKKTYTTPAGETWGLCDYLSEQTHVLIAGTTGAGKTTFLHSQLWSMLIDSPVINQFVFIDLKGGCELGRYERLPHTLYYCENIKKAVNALDGVLSIMDRRYKEMKRAGVWSYSGNNLWIVIDETADLLNSGGRYVLDKLVRIGRLGRAAKIHLLCCTQNPSRSSGGGLPNVLVQNMTCCIALRCRSAIESRQIIGIAGAEKLPRYGVGFMWDASGTREIRIPYTEPGARQERINYWLKNYGRRVGLLQKLFA